MQFYTVHEPPDPPVDRVDRADSLVFIGDRFTPVAVALGPLWLLANRLWHAFGLYVAAFAMATLIVLAAGLNLRWLSLIVTALNLIVGFEAASLRRWALERRGWRTLGTVSGRTLDECERRFLESWLPDQRLGSSPSSSSGASGSFATSGSAMRFADAITGNGSSGRLDGNRRRSWLTWRAGG